MDRQAQTTELSRRTFLTTTSTALIGATLGGLAGSVAKFDFWAKSKNLVSGIQ
jgi:hypothetical protein